MKGIGIGEVKVYMGSMFAGKTTKLVDDLILAGEGSICFKPKVDDRAGDDSISTHDGIEFPATPVEQASMILYLLDSEITTVGIEEASLFLDDPTLIPTIETLREMGFNVVITGLDLDSDGKPFGQMPEIAILSDECIKLRTNCVHCGSKASLSKFKGNKDSVVAVGGEEAYEPVCRNCY